MHIVPTSQKVVGVEAQARVTVRQVSECVSSISFYKSAYLEPSKAFNGAQIPINRTYVDLIQGSWRSWLIIRNYPWR